MLVSMNLGKWFWDEFLNSTWCGPQDRQVGLLTTTTFGSVDVQLGISQPLQVRHFPSISTKVCGDGADSGQGGARGPPPPPLIAVLRAQCNDAIRTLEFARDVTSTDPADKDPSLRTADVATCQWSEDGKEFFLILCFPTVTTMMVSASFSMAKSPPRLGFFPVPPIPGWFRTHEAWWGGSGSSPALGTANLWFWSWASNIPAKSQPPNAENGHLSHGIGIGINTISVHVYIVTYLYLKIYR